MVAALLERARLRTMFWLRTAFAIAAMRGSSEAVPPKIWSRFALRVAWSHKKVWRGIVGCAELGGGVVRVPGQICERKKVCRFPCVI